MYERLFRGASPIVVTAALSIALLVVASGVQLGKQFATPAPVEPAPLEPIRPRPSLTIEDIDGNGVPDWQDQLMRSGLVPTTSTSTVTGTETDPIAGLGGALIQTLASGYLSLKDHDSYTPERGEQLAETLAQNFRAPETFVPHTANELSLDPDTSVDRALRYRADMRVAFEPLISDEEYELTLYAAYVQTNDPSWLERLSRSAERYRAAKNNALGVTAPEDAAQAHLHIINALGAYADNLDRMAHFAQDPLASIALLQAYNEKERDINLAFDALTDYYARKIIAE